jgi:Predicted membrane protein
MLRLVINFLALLVVINVISGINSSGWVVLIVTAIVIGVLNAVIKPFLIILTLPINILTLGIFTLFINAFLFYLASVIVKGFYVEDFWSAFFGALVFSIVSVVLSAMTGSRSGTQKNNK